MSRHTRDDLRTVSRRRVLLGAGSAGIAGLAGCLGGEDDEGDEDGDDGSGGADSGGSGGDSSDGDGSDASDGDQFPEWDPTDPEFPQLATTLLDTDFHVGTTEFLETAEPRDEPRYGQAPPETPDDEGEWLDPDTISFSLVPTEDPTVYRDVMQPLMDNIAEETGKDVEYYALDSYAAQIEAMRSERLHAAGFSTGATAFAVNLAGAVPFGIQIAEDRFGYRLWLITQADSDIDSLEDIAGRDVAHVEQSSNSGHQAPRALFTAEGVEPGEDYEITFSGSHENSIRGIYHGDYEAAPIASTVLRRQHDDGAVDAEDLKVIWASDPFPTTSFAYRYNLAPEIQEGIRRAHLEYDYSGTSIEEQFDRGQFVEIDYATHWDVILQIQQQNDVEYNTENV